MTQANIDALARRLVEARRSSTPMATPTDWLPGDAAETYAVQEAVIALLGEPVAAWKVGAPAPADTPGVAPNCAPIMKSQVLASPARLASSDHRLFGVESELAFRLGSDMRPRETPYTRDEALAALDGVAVAIEEVESRLSDWPDTDANLILADCQGNGLLIVGEFGPIPANLDCANQRVIQKLGGGETTDKIGGLASGEPIWLIAWLANQLSGRSGSLSGRGLKAGDIVTTGSWTGVNFAAANTRSSAEFPGFGSAEVVFE